MTVEAHKETLGFQTEVRQLLDLVIHSLYSNKEVFLRELVSNASDAADKLRFEALTDDALYEGQGELQIWVTYDKEARTVTVRDNGIGMSRQEVVDHIGTIARSGTRAFFQSLTGDQARDSQLIGQFGVGFYSAFIVADRVTLTTRRAGLGAEHGVRWESTGGGEYTLETLERAERGTEVVLHLRPDEDEFLDGWRLRAILRKFSDHIALPIRMPKEGNPLEWEVVNQGTALWARPKAEVTEEQYREFYPHVSHDFGEPLAWTHNRVEGALEYTSLLYLPARAPFDIWDRRERHGVKLYVRRVFIMDDAEQLMPPYLRFVRGVIDAQDLPLNISREILQQNRQIDSIRSGSVKKLLGLLEHLAKEEPEKYATFWKEFGRVFKEGVVDDPVNRERIAGLLRFASTRGEGEKPSVSLGDYVARMKEGQDAVYYITADSYSAARHSPHLEVFEQEGIEVLLLTDGIDEWVVSNLTEFEGKPLRSVAKGQLDLGKLRDETARQAAEAAADALKPLAERVKAVLGDRVQEVRVSQRLLTSPACLVAGEHDFGRHLERLLRASGQELPAARPVLELNPTHPLVKRLEQETGDRFGEWVEILFDQALLAEGSQLENPSAFVGRLNRMLLELSGGA
ncbi:MAG: molecular chaperone HtpG [Gammaproteobacteria bacterium]|nr:molecular chaperone HtpG [Gammaproteobacteria bacterium]